MLFMAAHAQEGYIAMLEAALITYFRSKSVLGLAKQAPGGEGIRGPPPYFCYVALHSVTFDASGKEDC